jgi:hypothetical protein
MQASMPGDGRRRGVADTGGDRAPQSTSRPGSRGQQTLTHIPSPEGERDDRSSDVEAIEPLDGIVLAVGAVALVAVMFSFPVDARPKPTPIQRCMERCQIGNVYCFDLCRLSPGKNNAMMSPARRPVTATGAPVRPTQRRR